MTIFTERKERIRFLKFMGVGLIGAVVDFGIANLLAKLFNARLDWPGTVSFICAIFSNFMWNRYWTYPDSRSRPFARQLLMFYLVNGAGYFIRLPILHFLEPPMRTFFQSHSFKLPLSPADLARNFTLAVAVGIVMLWNYFVNRYWTYNDIDSSNQLKSIS